MPKPLEHSDDSCQTILGFDFGMRRIGVAVGQTITRSANPLTIVLAQDGIPNWDEVANLIQTWQASTLVVGMPYQLDGSQQAITFAAKKFANRLQARFALPVHCVDERFTTKAARSEISELNNPGNNKQRKKNKAEKVAIDSYAAKLILQDYLDNF